LPRGPRTGYPPAVPRIQETLTFPRTALLAAVLAATLPAAAPAQEAECAAGRVTDIFIDNGSVFDVGRGDVDPRFTWAYRAVNRLHVRTRRSVVRRELLVRVGDCLDAGRLEDSERLLRALPFIADAQVFTVAQPDGSHHVVVETRDDWSLRVSPQWDADERFGLVGLEVREGNLLGTGNDLAGFVRRHQGARVYGASLATRQLLGAGVHAELGAATTPVGIAVVQRIAHPFRGESGRWAARQQVEHRERNFEYYVPGEDGGTVRRYFEEQRSGFDLAGVVRLGRRGRLTLVGVGLAGERTVYPRSVLTGGPPAAATTDPPDAPPGLDTVSAVRVVVMAGQRNVAFVRRGPLDAVRAQEDVRLGVEIEGSLGRSLTALGRDDDLHGALEVSLAGELGRLLWGLRASGEGRRDLGAPAGGHEWTDLFAQVDAWGYWKPGSGSRHTLAAAVGGVAGWRSGVPFQLTLGHRAGVRGLPRHAFAGERRVVATLEHRLYLGWPAPRLFDLGSAVFVDAGGIWGGPAGFSHTTPTETSAGAGLRFAFPPGTRRTYRVDVATPLGGRAPRGVVVTVGAAQALGRLREDDPQVRRSSRRPLTASLFRFPR
jgi:hypothetical protein